MGSVGWIEASRSTKTESTQVDKIRLPAYVAIDFTFQVALYLGMCRINNQKNDEGQKMEAINQKHSSQRDIKAPIAPFSV